MVWGVQVLTLNKKPPVRSGPNIPESQRHTVRITIRVPPAVAEALDELADDWGVGVSAVVVRLVENFECKPAETA